MNRHYLLYGESHTIELKVINLTYFPNNISSINKFQTNNLQHYLAKIHHLYFGFFHYKTTETERWTASLTSGRPTKFLQRQICLFKSTVYMLLHGSFSFVLNL